MGRTGCCCCPGEWKRDSWSDHLTVDFSFLSTGVTGSPTFSEVTDDGTTLACRIGSTAVMAIEANQNPCLQFDATLVYPGGQAQPNAIFGQIFSEWSFTPNGVTPGCSASFDGAYRYLRTYNTATGANVFLADASVPTAYIGTPAVFCGLAAKQGSNYYTRINYLDGTTFFGSGAQFEGILGKQWNFGAPGTPPTPYGAVCGTWGRAATIGQVGNCDTPFSLSTLGKIVTPCSVDFAQKLSFTAGSPDITFGWAICFSGNASGAVTNIYKFRFDRLYLQLG